jgi:hypothetical protein
MPQIFLIALHRWQVGDDMIVVVVVVVVIMID